jgi:chromosome partitioning protein
MFDRRTQASTSTLNTLRKHYSDHLWRSAIPVDTRLRDASKAGKIPSQFAPESRAVRAYKQLLSHLLDEQQQRDKLTA